MAHKQVLGSLIKPYNAGASLSSRLTSLGGGLRLFEQFMIGSLMYSRCSIRQLQSQAEQPIRYLTSPDPRRAIGRG